MARDSFRRGRVASAVVAAALLAVGGLGVIHAQKASPGNPPATFKYTESKVVGSSKLGFAPVVKAVFPTVVSIKSSKMVRTQFRGQRGRQGQDQLDPFRQFFGDQFGGQFPNVPDEQRSEGLGSGVIVSPEGYILTNNHVVDGATDVTVTLHDKREMKAQVIGADKRTDIALLRITGSNLPSVTLGDSSKVEVGDIVLAMGNPFGIGQTVTMGIVSAKGRAGMGIEEVEDFIQTDAPINPGNSGGALIDDE